MSNTFEQYDVVKVIRILNVALLNNDKHKVRPIVVGDVATVVEVYNSPPGYELECCSSDGKTLWQVGVRADDLELVKIK